MVGRSGHFVRTGRREATEGVQKRKAFLFLSFSFFSDKRKEHLKKSYFMLLRGRTMFDPCLGDADRVYFANRSIPRRRRLAKCPDPVSAHIRPTPAHLIMRACTHCPTHIQIRATPSPVFSFFRILRLNRSCDLYDGNAGRSGNCTCCRICRKCCRRHCYLIR